MSGGVGGNKGAWLAGPGAGATAFSGAAYVTAGVSGLAASGSFTKDPIDTFLRGATDLLNPDPAMLPVSGLSYSAGETVLLPVGWWEMAISMDFGIVVNDNGTGGFGWIAEYDYESTAGDADVLEEWDGSFAGSGTFSNGAKFGASRLLYSDGTNVVGFYCRGQAVGSSIPSFSFGGRVTFMLLGSGTPL